MNRRKENRNSRSDLEKLESRKKDREKSIKLEKEGSEYNWSASTVEQSEALYREKRHKENAWQAITNSRGSIDGYSQ